jgi:hypothetical protein
MLLSIRNALLPIQPYISNPPRVKPATPPPTTAPTARRLIGSVPESSQSEGETNEAHAAGTHEATLSDVETGSEADVESNTEHDSGAERESSASMASSWVDVQA